MGALFRVLAETAKSARSPTPYFTGNPPTV